MADYNVNKYSFNNNNYLLEDNRLSDDDVTRLSNVSANAASIAIDNWDGNGAQNISSLVINKLTQAQYNTISSPSNNQLYLITDDTIYAEKTYVDNLIANIDALPSQTNNSGKFLTTNGTAASWANVDALPSQSGNSGKYLTTNGTAASWSTLDLSNYVPISTEESYGDGYITNTISNGTAGYDGNPCIYLNSWYTEPGSAGEYDSEAYLEIDPYGITIAGNISFAWGGFDASSLSSGTVNWNRLPTSRIYDATASRTANTVLAAPNGSAGAAAFRKLVEADLPALAASKITSGTFDAARIPSLSTDKLTSGTLGIARGGTGGTTAATARANLGTLGSKSANGYEGMTNMAGADNVWIRTTSQGIIPYQSGGSTAGHSYLGTSSWYFYQAYIQTIYSNQTFGAVWNDYAEYRQLREDQEIPYGRIVIENGDDTLSLSTERLQPGGHVVSDTFGFAIGETDKCKLPIAVSGRALVYTYEDRNIYKPGDAVCAGPEGTVSKMSRKEIKEYPERIIGTVSAVPDYENWGTGNVAVDGRIWIYIK